MRQSAHRGTDGRAADQRRLSALRDVSDRGRDAAGTHGFPASAERTFRAAQPFTENGAFHPRVEPAPRRKAGIDGSARRVIYLYWLLPFPDGLDRRAGEEDTSGRWERGGGRHAERSGFSQLTRLFIISY